MKKLLVLLLATLVMGMVFAGSAHINGPGDLYGDSAEFLFAGVYGSAYVTGAQGAVICSDVAGVVAGNFQGVFNDNQFFGCTDALIELLAITTAAPDGLYTEKAGSFQEVLSLSGCSKPVETEMKIIITV